MQFLLSNSESDSFLLIYYSPNQNIKLVQKIPSNDTDVYLYDNVERGYKIIKSFDKYTEAVNFVKENLQEEYFKQ